MHRRAAIYAISHNQSLNSFIEDAPCIIDKNLLTK
ncbi:MAG: toxin-antitoxin system HicB family antitoxin [Oribacterium sp.]|nr:toxin-antitoxin system HicB family antitoxin [Oribacterium sp.]MBP3803292.1 toxin-antitoxin system HicB family antitoxin [Oribacterium sp.]MBP3895014.1 toxin-antitoxin system HicB family antitoxin [Mogibacterium sp.]MBR1856523.1 toxin-antitoxin system HicB family antitoxin [Oribacterium sp.]